MTRLYGSSENELLNLTGYDVCRNHKGRVSLSLIDMLESFFKDLDDVLTKVNVETVNCLANIDDKAD